ncbi:hypothetical protein MMC28_008189 [Mycoblastus sanguinarius]|nr:hypothetical protein [Mycoblastus sanguinarius]
MPFPPDSALGSASMDGGKYLFNGRHIYVTWSKSKIDSKEEFHHKLLTMLPPGVRIFGGRKLYQDGTLHYHVVFSFADKVHWPDAAKQFSIEGDTSAIQVEKLRRGQRRSDFLQKMVDHCAKDGDTFGERLLLQGAAVEQKKRKWRDTIDEPDEEVAEQEKRKWRDIIDELDEEKAWSMVRDIDPRAYMVHFPALEKAISRPKRAKVAATERE